MSFTKSIAASILVLMAVTGCTRSQPVVEAEPAPVPIIQDFSITAEDMEYFTGLLQDQELAEKITASPDEFLALMKQIIDEPEELFLLADKQHALPSDYIPEDLRPLTEYPLLLNRNDLSLREMIMPAVLKMDAAARDDGIKLVYSSSYRSYEYQKGLFARHVREMGEEEAAKVSARPGTSQHQLGTTIDFGSITDEFADTPAGRWLYDHAPEYGFTLSYPRGYEDLTGYSWECWHYRYIGIPASRMTQEYFGGIQHYFLYFINDNLEWFKAHRT